MVHAFAVRGDGSTRVPLPGASFARPGQPAPLPDPGFPQPDGPGRWIYRFDDGWFTVGETIEVSCRYYHTKTVTVPAYGPYPVSVKDVRLDVGLDHQWPCELAWNDFGARPLEDGDVIRTRIEKDVVSPEVVDFVLTSELRWWKEIVVPDGEGASFTIHTGAPWFGSMQFRDSVQLWAHQVQKGQLLSLRKARTLGFVGTTYLLGGLDQLLGGSRVTFTWQSD